MKDDELKKVIKKGESETTEFKEVSGGFSIIFRKDIYTEEYLRGLKLNERQIKAVMYVKEKGKITNKEYQEVCRTSERTATRDLSQLVTIELFEQIGITGKGTEYVLRHHKDANDAIKAPQRRQTSHERLKGQE